MKFFSAYDLPPRPCSSCSGSAERAVFKEVLDESGVKQVRKSGVENFQDMIEASKESTMIYNILNSFDDGTLLNRVPGFYADISNMPSNIHESYALINNCRKEFFALKPEVRAKFGNDFNAFLSASFDKSFLQAFSSDSVVDSVDSGVEKGAEINE